MISANGDAGLIGIYFMWPDLTDNLNVGDIISAFHRDVFEPDDKGRVCASKAFVNASGICSIVFSKTPKFIGS